MFRSRVDCTTPVRQRAVPLPQTFPSDRFTESRVRVAGKFLFVGERKLYVRGVTYGPFRPSPAGEYHSRASVARDFARMAESGFNAVRLYTVPPRWLLDEAWQNGLHAMVGLPWEQHVAFLDHRSRAADIARRVRAGVHDCAGHPAVLCYAIGNEIPTHVVRWYGHKKVERFLSRLFDVAKAEDPSSLVTYVNYPSTEYLDLPFLDLTCFNVYLECAERLKAYVGRLQNIAGDRPLLMGEIGVDSIRGGDRAQAELLPRQLRAAFDGGCAGAFVFSWTDEWHRGGHDVEGWGFGLTRRDREAKPALAAVGTAGAGAAPLDCAAACPRVTVVVCTYNGSRTIGQTLAGLKNVDYPDFEVIVVDDGSTDGTGDIVREHDVRLITTPNRGLSHARNVGLRAATGEIVAYVDDDAWPDADWLRYLAHSFLTSKHAGIGGPNLTPDDDGVIAQCVGVAPGGPTHVLLTDEEAEHIPGCNMAFRRSCLEEMGGFDERFHTAGDDVDVCWRIQNRGWSLGFSPAAVVWHRRRSSVRAYWRQQVNYGRAEAVLERKWPEKYNAAGHAVWTGRLYGGGQFSMLFLSRRRIYHGVWGNALFQSVYHVRPGLLSALPLMPEWFLLIVVLAAVSAMGVLSPPLLLAAPLGGLALLASLVQAVRQSARTIPLPPSTGRVRRATARVLLVWLHILQPVARLIGRSHFGLTPWRGCRGCGWAAPVPRRLSIWSETWQGVDERLTSLEESVRQTGAVVVRGGEFDRWDIELRGGLFGSARVRMLIEEHGSGKQLVRFLMWPHVPWVVPALVLPLIALCYLALSVRGWAVAAAAALPLAAIVVQTLREVSSALAAASKPVKDARA